MQVGRLHKDIAHGLYIMHKIDKGSDSMLTPKQELFVQSIIKGMSQADAYRTAYATKNMSDKTIHEAASRLMADSKVSARVKELREQVDKETIMSAQKRLEWLTEAIGNKDIAVNDKLKAIDIMNRMQGEYIQKVETEVKNAKVNINIELSDD
jgi:phage terminase small subunit